jgi:hypothetical protein
MEFEVIAASVALAEQVRAFAMLFLLTVGT